MYFQQFYLTCLSQASYMLGPEGVARVVDPQRDGGRTRPAATKPVGDLGARHASPDAGNQFGPGLTRPL
jgi:hypothetical protein